jgi:tetratricopeptide (TPR) repeat protein
MKSVPEERHREVPMSHGRKVGIILWACLVGLVPISCSKHKPNNKAALAIAREQELARQQREAVVQQKEDSEQADRLQTLQAIAARERASLKVRAESFRQQWQAYFARKSEEEKTYQEMVKSERAGLTEKDKETVKSIEEKIKAGKRLDFQEEEYSLQKKVLEKTVGKYLLREMRDNPSRRAFLGLIPRRQFLVERAEEDEHRAERESKARADMTAFALQVQQMNQAADLVKGGHYDLAVAGLTTALEKSPFVPEFYALRGAVYSLTELDFKKALSDLDEAQRLNAEDPWVWYCRGLTQWLKGNARPARADFREAVRRDPTLAKLVRQVDPQGK